MPRQQFGEEILEAIESVLGIEEQLGDGNINRLAQAFSSRIFETLKQPRRPTSRCRTLRLHLAGLPTGRAANLSHSSMSCLIRCRL